jgi:hypothetical protein
MKTFVAFFCVLFTVHTLVADVYSAAMGQARNAAGGGNNNPQQNNRPQPATPTQNNPLANPVLEATLRNTSNLRVDFDALGKLSELKSDSPPKKLLLNDLNSAAQGAKPTESSVAKLADSLASAVAGKTVMKEQHQKLAQDIHAIFNSSHLSPAQQKMISDDVQKILQSGGVSSDETINVVTDLQTIMSQTK